MYVRLINNNTKLHYRQILKETTEMISEMIRITPEISIYHSIYNQLIDVKKNVVDKQVYTGDESIETRYNFGVIAVKNFEEEDPLYYRLCDLYAGAMRYANLH